MSHEIIYKQLLESFIKAVKGKDLLTEKLYSYKQLDSADLNSFNRDNKNEEIIHFNIQDMKEYIGEGTFTDEKTGITTSVRVAIFFDKLNGFAVAQRVKNLPFNTIHNFCTIRFPMNEDTYNAAIDVLSKPSEQRCLVADHIFRDALLSGQKFYTKDDAHVIDTGFVNRHTPEGVEVKWERFYTPEAFVNLLRSNDL